MRKQNFLKRAVSLLSAGIMSLSLIAGTIPAAYATDNPQTASEVCTVDSYSVVPAGKSPDKTTDMADIEVYVYEYNDSTETDATPGKGEYVNVGFVGGFQVRYVSVPSTNLVITPQNGYALVGIECAQSAQEEGTDLEVASWSGTPGTGTFTAPRIDPSQTVRLYFAKPYTVKFDVWGAETMVDGSGKNMSTYINETLNDVEVYPVGFNKDVTTNVTGVSPDTITRVLEEFKPNRTITLPTATVKSDKSSDGYYIKKNTWTSELFGKEIGSMGTTINLDDDANTTLNNLLLAEANNDDNTARLKTTILSNFTVKWYDRGELIQTDTVAATEEPNYVTIQNKMKARGDYTDSNGTSHTLIGWMDKYTDITYKAYGNKSIYDTMPPIATNTTYVAIYEDTYYVQWYDRNNDVIEFDTPVVSGDQLKYKGGDAYISGESSEPLEVEDSYYSEWDDTDYTFVKWSEDPDDTTPPLRDASDSYLGTVTGNTFLFAVYKAGEPRKYEIVLKTRGSDNGTASDTKITSFYVNKDGTATVSDDNVISYTLKEYPLKSTTLTDVKHTLDLSDYTIQKAVNGRIYTGKLVGFTSKYSGTESDITTELKTNNTDFEATPRATTYYAVYDFSDAINVSWVTHDGTTIAAVDSGETPEAPSNPADWSDSDYNYSFIGWSTRKDDKTGIVSSFGALTADTTYYAIYSATKKDSPSTEKTYTVTFVDNDGTTVLATVENLKSGDAVTYSGDLPTKPEIQEGHDTYGYTFIGWSTSTGTTEAEYEVKDGIQQTAFPNIANSDVTYYAVYLPWGKSWEIDDMYEVMFKNEDGTSTLKTMSQCDGSSVTYDGDLPTKDSEYSNNGMFRTDYTFIGWSTSPNATTAEYEVTDGVQETAFPVVSGANVTYYAVFKASAVSGISTGYVTWMNGSTVLQKDYVETGDKSTISADKVPTLPENANTSEYTYAFEGWSKDPNATTGEKDTSKLGYYSTGADIVYYAIFSAKKNEAQKASYTANFYNGSKLVYSTTVEEGTTPSYKGTTLTLPNEGADTRLHTYIFAGWSTSKNATTASALKAISADTNYYAVFTVGDTPSYSVTWYNGSSIADTTTGAKKGDAFKYAGKTISNYSDDNYNYTFLGWSLNKDSKTGTKDVSNLGTVSGNTSVYAIFSKAQIDKYLVQFLNYNGESLYSLNNLKSGVSVSYGSKTTPTRTKDDNYKYTFIGWDTNKNATTPAYTGLNPTFPNVNNSNVTYYAIYQKTEIPTYTVSWVGWMNGMTSEVKEGDYAIAPYTPWYTEPPEPDPEGNTIEKDYYWDFVGWSTKENDTVGETDTTKFGPITKDTKFYAVFEKVYYKKYTVTWKIGNKTLEVDKDALEKHKVSFDGVVPELPDGADTTRYKYTFSGWSTDPNAKVGTPIEDLDFLDGNTTYYAIYTRKSLLGTAIVNFKVGDEVIQKEVDIDEPFDFEIPDPDKPSNADDAYDYEFKGWSTDPNATTGVAFKDLPLTEDDVSFYAIFKATPKKPTALSNDINFIVQCRRNSDSHKDMRMNPIENTYEFGNIEEKDGKFTITAKVTKLDDYCTAYGRLLKWEHKNPYAERYSITLTWNAETKKWETNDSFLIRVECVDAPAKTPAVTVTGSGLNAKLSSPPTGIEVPIVAIGFLSLAALSGIAFAVVYKRKRS